MSKVLSGKKGFNAACTECGFSISEDVKSTLKDKSVSDVVSGMAKLSIAAQAEVVNAVVAMRNYYTQVPSSVETLVNKVEERKAANEAKKDEDSTEAPTDLSFINTLMPSPVASSSSSSSSSSASASIMLSSSAASPARTIQEAVKKGMDYMNAHASFASGSTPSVVLDDLNALSASNPDLLKLIFQVSIAAHIGNKSAFADQMKACSGASFIPRVAPYFIPATTKDPAHWNQAYFHIAGALFFLVLDKAMLEGNIICKSWMTRIKAQHIWDSSLGSVAISQTKKDVFATKVLVTPKADLLAKCSTALKSFNPF